MVSVWHDGTLALAVGFPPLLQSLLFWIFASLVVHVCQRLVEHTAFSVDPSSRQNQLAASLGEFFCRRRANS